MVYGTSKVFRPEFEGRIASDVETACAPGILAKIPVAVAAVGS